MFSSVRTRRVVFTVALVALLVVLGVIIVRTTADLRTAATPTASVSAPPDGRYTFSAQFPADATVNPGGEYAVIWQPKLDISGTHSEVSDVDCIVTFFGPYVTQADAAQIAAALASQASTAESFGTPGAPTPTELLLTPALTANPLTFSNHTARAQQQDIFLPATFALGYYVVDARDGDAFGLIVADAVFLVASDTP